MPPGLATGILQNPQPKKLNHGFHVSVPGLFCKSSDGVVFVSDRFGGSFMRPEIEIYDTTLRDGSQGEGINFSVLDKLRIAEKLDGFGVHYIEGGWPGSNPKDIEFFEQAKHKKFSRAQLAAFGSSRRKNIKVEADDQVRLLIEAA